MSSDQPAPPRPPQQTGASGRGRRGLIPILLLLLVAVGAAFVVWYTAFRTVHDPEAAVAANNRGVAQMERFEYGPAADSFREARQKDPDWLVPKINLAIALLNYDPPSHHNEVVELLTGVLKERPDDPHANYTM